MSLGDNVIFDERYLDGGADSNGAEFGKIDSFGV